MKIISICSCGRKHSMAVFNDVPVEMLARLRKAAETLALQVHIGPPDWPDIQSYVEDLEEEAAELQEELDAERENKG